MCYPEIMFVLKSVCLSLVGFLSGSIDAVIGGGNLITIALLTLIGLSPLKAIASMQIITLFQSLSSTALYAQKKLINWKQASFFALFGGMGSFIGANLLLKVNQDLLEFLAGSLMSVTLILMPQFQKKDGAKILGLLKNFYKRLLKRRPVVTHKPKTKIILAVITFGLGIYGGFYGAGRGLLILIIFYLIGESDIKTTVANTKPADTLISLVFLFVFFKFKNLLSLELLIPLSTSSIAGSFAGVEIADRIGVKYLRIALYGITIISAAKLLYF